MWGVQVPGALSALKKLRNHFNTRGDSSLNEKSVYSYVLAQGYKCDLTGWTHTSCSANSVKSAQDRISQTFMGQRATVAGKYAHGFLRNKPGDGKATVSGLEPGAEYAFKIYQYAAQFAGNSEIVVNGCLAHNSLFCVEAPSTALRQALPSLPWLSRCRVLPLDQGDSKGLAAASKSAEATKLGLAQADGDGRIHFAFKRISPHVPQLIF